jgi:hypothetical protein
VKIDGQAASWTPSTYAASIDARLAVPSIISIDVEMSGGYEGGTAYLTLIAEDDPDTDMKVWCVVTEDHEIATGSWGGYNGQEMMWIPVAFPLSYSGETLEFSGPFPDTVHIQGDYVLDPVGHPYDNLNVVTFVQGTTASKEILNTDYRHVADLTGISGAGSGSASLLTVGPNPCSGSFSIECSLPSTATGTVQVFDLTGRVVETFAAEENISADIMDSGVYFVRLTTSNGDVVSRRLTVVR